MHAYLTNCPVHVVPVPVPPGQDKSLQSALRLASLRHFALACSYGLKAQRAELVVQAAIAAWNVAVSRLFDPLIRVELRVCFCPPDGSAVIPCRHYRLHHA